MSAPQWDDSPPPEPKAPAGSAARSLISKQASLTSWANTTDRTARMASPTDKSPAQIAWHAKKLGLDPDNLSDDDRKRAEAARQAWMISMSRKAQIARQRKKAERLRLQAAQLDAAADEAVET